MDASLIDWSRILFAVTAAYHWLFVPLTLGLSIVMAIMETIYVIKGDEFWRKTTRYWMKLFAINFAVGIATGIILEFEFGTNWSNYSWFVGDIFGAPLAIEGVLAFFMEATFFAVMFFGWNKVGKKFHLTSTWLTGIGASLSAFWILVANAWMQHPTGTVFNPDLVRSEMVSFWAVVGNPVAISKFCHTVFSGWMTGAAFTVAVSSWYLIRRRETKFAVASIGVACFVGLVGGLVTFIAGDTSALDVAKYQPMKLATMEHLDKGGRKAPFTVVPGVEVPAVLSFLATHNFNGYVPGVQDIMNGYVNNDNDTIPSVAEKMSRGRLAVQALKNYTELKKSNPEQAGEALKIFRANEKYLGYGYIENANDLIPHRGIMFWAFRLMVGCGMLLFLILIVLAVLVYKKKLDKLSWMHYVGILALPLVYICEETGWVVAEVGRQPWTIQNLLPVNVSVSSVSTTAVQTTLAAFAIIFFLFIVIEIKILIKAISKGPQIDEANNSVKNQ